MSNLYNDLLRTNFQDSTTISALIAKGATDFKYAMELALVSNITTSVDLLKLHILPNDGLYLACRYGNIDLINYFLPSATNTHDCILINPTNDTIYNLLKVYVNNDDECCLQCNLQRHDHVEINRLLDLGIFDLNNTLILACQYGNLCCINNIIDRGANNINECLISLINSRNSEVINLLLSKL